ncbi:putative membrane protein [Neolecta irregularis DAH-3]|uniref:Putative membrane protein n=1 Tax=Neolecta irregularis (strain DAH-3) TaxID=1198029 RepID=A0A1U7LGL0_NEOID|nr:putative membrane protein [Neolecta irregularis DAH-3]|eukprot:OLL21787.1 putative membrane protein [Neolecta irregularis DAH-3]
MATLSIHPTIFLAILLYFACPAWATTLTYQLEANERACFFTQVQNGGEKIAFYFAVQSGGAFDIDYEVSGPDHEMILQGTKERQGDYVFTAKKPGEYTFCFSNDMSTFAQKLVDFEITVENEPRAELPAKPASTSEQPSLVEESIFKISGHLSHISRNQKYFRTRENRNFSTVRSTESRVFTFSLLESCLMVASSVLQVFIVRTFFSTRTRKGYV